MAPAPVTSSVERLLIVSPVYNEAGHLERTAQAIAAQTRRPDRWVIVDDVTESDVPGMLEEAATPILLKAASVRVTVAAPPEWTLMPRPLSIARSLMIDSHSSTDRPCTVV